MRSPAGCAAMRPVGEAVVDELISPITVMSDVFCVTNATSTCGSIARSLMRLTTSFDTSSGVLPAAGTKPA